MAAADNSAGTLELTPIVGNSLVMNAELLKRITTEGGKLRDLNCR